MQVITRIVSPRPPLHRPSATITTTLYDLLNAIQEEVPAGTQGDKLATEVVVHLLDAGRIHFIGDAQRLDAS